ncbi:hypothetical protein WME90_20905 [Sorangium sp. So ce375]
MLSKSETVALQSVHGAQGLRAARDDHFWIDVSDQALEPRKARVKLPTRDRKLASSSGRKAQNGVGEHDIAWRKPDVRKQLEHESAGGIRVGVASHAPFVRLISVRQIRGLEDKEEPSSYRGFQVEQGASTPPVRLKVEPPVIMADGARRSVASERLQDIKRRFGHS